MLADTPASSGCQWNNNGESACTVGDLQTVIQTQVDVLGCQSSCDQIADCVAIMFQPDNRLGHNCHLYVKTTGFAEQTLHCDPTRMPDSRYMDVTYTWECTDSKGRYHRGSLKF